MTMARKVVTFLPVFKNVIAIGFAVHEQIDQLSEMADDLSVEIH